MQVPEAQSALVAMDPKDGAVVALVGGFDFFESKFNRVTQARRQPGSAFKPFVYAAAFDKGYTPASVVVDAPIVIDSAGNDQAWRPKEMEGEFCGPIRLREAMAHSRNLVSVRLMRDIGVEYTRDYVTRFGFDKTHVPEDLTMALGTAELSPLQVVTAYATFANGGFRVNPYYVDRILDAAGKTLYQAEPLIACAQCAAVDTTSVANAAFADGRPPSAHLVAAADQAAAAANRGPADRGAAGSGPPHPPRIAPPGSRGASLDEGVHDGKSLIPPRSLAPQVISAAGRLSVVRHDGGCDPARHRQQALVLGRDDIAGKTGTTNDAHDAWFSGFNGDLVTTVWTGFDQDRSLGELEQGARAALPTWIFFMHEALAGVPRHKVPVPDGIVTAREFRPTPDCWRAPTDPNAIMEKFIDGSLPKAETTEGPNNRIRSTMATNRYSRYMPKKYSQRAEDLRRAWPRRLRGSWPSTASRIFCRPSARRPTAWACTMSRCCRRTSRSRRHCARINGCSAGLARAHLEGAAAHRARHHAPAG